MIGTIVMVVIVVVILPLLVGLVACMPICEGPSSCPNCSFIEQIKRK